MYNYHDKRKFIYSIFLILILVIGIGYAYLTSNLSISGNTNVATNSWNIHFENINVTNGSVTATSEPTLSSNNTVITYTIDLNRPKEFYEFKVDVKNDGTLPGKVSISELSGLSSDAEPIIDYSIKYTNGNPVSIGDILNAGAKKTIKVRVFYKDDISASDFPSNDLNLTLTYTLQYVQSEADEFDTSTLIEQLKTENSSCFTKYTGQVTDEVGSTVSASNVYFDKCENKRNIIFNNICWQVIRTTETGGIKMLFNGEVVDGKCENNRGYYNTIYGENYYSSQEMNSEYLYGNSFRYDASTSEYTLEGTFTSTWSDSTYEDLLSKYTCKNVTGVCTNLYNVIGYSSNTVAYLYPYKTGNLSRRVIAGSAFNGTPNNPAMVGYMFNKVYYTLEKSPGTVEYKYGNTFTYSNGIYTLSGTTQSIGTGQTITSWSSGYNSISNTHYTCWNASGECTTISYIFNTTSSKAYYILISDGKSISDALVEMLSANDVNRYNSSIKGIIDNWYTGNMSNKTNMLEDVVYCNSRDIRALNGWSPTGTLSSYLRFKGYYSSSDLSCVNETDQFAVSNNKAKLTYPVGLLLDEERNNINVENLLKINAMYWTMTPNYYQRSAAHNSFIAYGGSSTGDDVGYSFSVRPVVSLASGAVISEGDGSTTNPWVIQE